MLKPSHRFLWAAAVAVSLTAAACGDRASPGETEGDRSARRGPMGKMMDGMGPGMMSGRPEGMRLPDGVSADQLAGPESRGARLASRFCSGCHGIPSPGRLGAEEWPDVLDRMFGRMEHTSRMSGMRNRMMRGRGTGLEVENPTAEQRRLLRAYYRKHALVEVDEGQLPDLPGRQTFREACSQCHGLPDPESRSPRQWSDIVPRMRGHMSRTEDIDPLTDDEADTVLRYLRRASRSGAAARDTASH